MATLVSLVAIGDHKTSALKYGQTVADVATLWIDRRCEVTVGLVANAPKYSMDSH